MFEFFMSYGLFLAKIVTGLIALVIAVAIVGSSRKHVESNELVVTNLNKKYKALKDKLMSAVLDKKAQKQYMKEQAKAAKQEEKNQTKKSDQSKPKLYVLEFDGDIKASQVASLRDEITALLSVATPRDEIFLKLDNSGGIVHEHGLAASQLQRIKNAQLRLTVSVDKVAASGGYMMACVADKIIAAPFAIVGSIGVLAQLPNFNRLLDRHGVDFEQHTAGEYKRTVTMFGKNTEKEREKLNEDLQETHTLFRDFVSENRSKLDISQVATGEHWYGVQALGLNLVDEIKTSDDFLVEAQEEFDMYQIQLERKKKMSEKMFGGLFSSLQAIRDAFAQQQNRSEYL